MSKESKELDRKLSQFFQEVSEREFTEAQVLANIFGNECIDFFNHDTAQKLAPISPSNGQLETIYHWRNRTPVTLSSTQQSLMVDPPHFYTHVTDDLPGMESYHVSVCWDVRRKAPIDIHFTHLHEHFDQVDIKVLPAIPRTADDVMAGSIVGSGVTFDVSQQGKHIIQNNRSQEKGESTLTQYRYKYLGNFSSWVTGDTHHLYGGLGKPKRFTDGDNPKRKWDWQSVRSLVPGLS